MTLELIGLTKSCDGKNIINDFDLTISDDDRLLFTGGQGSGKTMLFRLIAGLEKPDSGEINLLGDYKHDEFTVGMSFQDLRLFEDLSAAENVALVQPMHSERISIEELSKLISEERTTIPVSGLSESERHAVSIVRACLFPSNMLLLDEPFTGMSDEERKKAWRFILEAAGHKAILIARRTPEGFEEMRRIEMG